MLEAGNKCQIHELTIGLLDPDSLLLKSYQLGAMTQIAY